LGSFEMPAAILWMLPCAANTTFRPRPAHNIYKSTHAARHILNSKRTRSAWTVATAFAEGTCARP
jgi:hypothetical protein